MRYAEIFFENSNNKDDQFYEKLEKFLFMLVENTDHDILEFLLKNPLYRATSENPKDDIMFGTKPIIKDRISLDTPRYIVDTLDNFLKSQGFKALRTNSIFATGDKDFANRFRSLGRHVYMIFPPRKFYFTWNRLIHDFFLPDMLDDENFDLFTFDIKSAMTNPKYQDFYIDVKMAYINSFSEDRRKTLNRFFDSYEEEENYEQLYKIVIFDLESDKSIRRNFYRNLLKNLSYHYMKRPEQLKKLFYVNEDSIYARAFTNTNFEEAVKSGNEIMITNEKYFYMSEKILDDEIQFVEKVLKKYGLSI